MQSSSLFRLGYRQGDNVIMNFLPDYRSLFFLLIMLQGTVRAYESREDRHTSAPSVRFPGVHGGVTDDVLLENPDCGVVCLYVYLNLLDVPCLFEEIQRDLSPGSAGVSMLDLKRAARAYNGVQAEVVEADPTELYENLPAIARLASTDGIEGHYVVLVSKEQDHIVLIDGSSNLLLKYDLGNFERAYSGFAVVVNKEKDHAAYLIALAVLLVGTLVTLLLRRTVSREK